MSGGWYNCRLAATGPTGQHTLRQLQQDRDSAVVVLILNKAPDKKELAGAQGAAAAAAAKDDRLTPPPGAGQQQQQDVVSSRVTALVRKWEVEAGVVLQDLEQHANGSWKMTPAGNLAPGAAQLPVEVSSSGFWSYLQQSFDPPQIQAITASAAHLARSQQRWSGGGGGGGDKDDQAADLLMGEEDEEGPGQAAGGRCLTDVPFTLIQGPPGTGKTHTVLGVLNTWHLVQFQRFYRSLDAAVRDLADSKAVIDQVLVSEEFPGRLAPRPRILVCAPSNAAIDELLERILSGIKFGDKYLLLAVAMTMG
eukprot:gene3845-4102_t